MQGGQKATIKNQAAFVLKQNKCLKYLDFFNGITKTDKSMIEIDGVISNMCNKSVSSTWNFFFRLLM